MVRYESSDPWYVRHYKGVMCVVWFFLMIGVTLGVFLR